VFNCPFSFLPQIWMIKFSDVCLFIFVHKWEVCDILPVIEITGLINLTMIQIFESCYNIYLWNDWNTRSTSRNILKLIINCGWSFNIEQIYPVLTLDLEQLFIIVHLSILSNYKEGEQEIMAEPTQNKRIWVLVVFCLDLVESLHLE
jgi:hypothetical protein